MSNTRFDTGNDTAETHEDAIRQYLRAHNEIAKSTHLTDPSDRADAAA